MNFVIGRIDVDSYATRDPWQKRTIDISGHNQLAGEDQFTDFPVRKADSDIGKVDRHDASFSDVEADLDASKRIRVHNSTGRRFADAQNRIEWQNRVQKP